MSTRNFFRASGITLAVSCLDALAPWIGLLFPRVLEVPVILAGPFLLAGCTGWPVFFLEALGGCFFCAFPSRDPISGPQESSYFQSELPGLRGSEAALLSLQLHAGFGVLRQHIALPHLGVLQGER